MSAIDQVIARSRRPGGFSERKQFTVARKRAIQKLRRFALADPHYYVLELIQAATANGAEYVDIAVDDESFTMSYIGGGIAHDELAQLFDFLFASKDRTDIGHVRELALGINAALLFEPTRVIVESGDGSARGTTRMVMHADTDTVEVGRPEKPLHGTYVRIEGLQRNRLPGGFAESGDIPRECGAIEERCLAAPIPIIVNGVSLFGFSKQRTPGLFGYKAVHAFDEGDLYGTIGHRPIWGTPSFQLLTRGVLVQEIEEPLLDPWEIGGVICFDALHKTVDHSGIVRDDRFLEMVERIRPYAQRLVQGQAQASPYQATWMGVGPLLPTELRELLRGNETIVVAPPGTEPSSDHGQLAAAIAKALGAEVLCVPKDRIPAMRVLSRNATRIVCPDLESRDDLAFYRRPPAEPPARPWLARPVDVDPIEVRVLASMLARAQSGESDEPSQLLISAIGARIGDVGEVRARVYTPARGEIDRRGLHVRVLTSERIVWEGEVPASLPGHVLEITVPDVPSKSLATPFRKGGPVLAFELAEAVAIKAEPALASARELALENLRADSIAPRTPASRLALAAAVAGAVLRLREDEGDTGLTIAMLDSNTRVDLLELPLLRTHSGDPVSLRAVVRIVEHNEGLVYGTVPRVTPTLAGLDSTRILDLDEWEERMILALFGEATYVRIDAREVLAQNGGVECRDLALGLRPYPDYPLAVEGADPTGLAPEQRELLERSLIEQLAACYLGLADDLSHAEDRRQACRHLQLFACRVATEGEDRHHGVFNLPLFLDGRGLARTPREVFARLREGPLRVFYGHGFGGSELAALTAAATRREHDAAQHPIDTLVAPPFLHRLLRGVGRADPAFAFEISDDGADREESRYLVRRDIEDPAFSGFVGIPLDYEGEPDIAVIRPGGRRMHALPEIAREFGVVGVVRSRTTFASDRQWREALTTAVRGAARSALEQLLHGLDQADDPDRHVTTLLEFAARHLMLSAEPGGEVVPTVVDALARKILHLPIFPSAFGGLASGWRLLTQACSRFHGRIEGLPRTDLATDAPAHLQAWIGRTMSEKQVARPANHQRIPPTGASGPTESPAADVLADSLEHWVHCLRPDRVFVDRKGNPLRARVWITSPGDPGCDPDGQLCDGGQSRLDVNGAHWLVRWARQTAAREPESLAWLLIACYAHLNAELELVDNHHERAFQRRVIETLESGELGLVNRAQAAENVPL